MNQSQKSRAAAQRSLERRQREDSAPRLKHLLPNLAFLEITVVEQMGASTTKHRKPIVVSSAPALFVISCGDARCEDGGHDITSEVMRSLRDGRTTFENEHACDGQTGSAPCTRRIHYQLRAKYA